MAQVALSGDMQERARKNERAILNRLISVGQSTLATFLGVNESTISKRKSDAYFEEVAATLAVLGLKAVPTEMKCYRPEEIDPYIQLAQAHLRRVKSVHDLADDDPE